MCGIYGSHKVSKFEILDAANKVRGNFASGILYCDNDTYDVQKMEGFFDWNKRILPEGYIYLGHNQAPTSVERKWKEHNSHPFECKDWIVAHNGVLTNYKKLIKEYIPNHENLVDSSVIPALLDHFKSIFQEGPNQELAIIQNVLGLLKGTFGLWVYNIESGNIYLARQGSTLFYDHDSFSSVKGTDYNEIKEGVVYSFGWSGVKEVGKFASQSPFLEI